MRPFVRILGCLAVVATVGPVCLPVFAAELPSTVAVFRNFEEPGPAWQLADARPGVQLLSQGTVVEDARQGRGSERIVVAVPAGESAHFTCPVGPLPVLDEFEARLWAKTNCPGAALAARIVLPRSIDPKTGLPRTVLVTGDSCELPHRWQQLRLSNVTALLAAKARVMRAAPGSHVDTREAYVDAMVLVVPGGPSQTTIWTDALEIDGVLMPETAISVSTAVKRERRHTHDPQVKRAQFFSAPPISQADPQGAPSPAGPNAQFQGATLLVAGRPFLPIGIEWNGEPISYLAARGFNTIWLDTSPSPEQTADAARVNVWFVCKPPKPDSLEDVGLGHSLDRVLAWNLGTPAGPQELEYFRRWANGVRVKDAADERPIIISPRGDWMPTSRHADVLVARHPMDTQLTSDEFAEWVATLPNLTRPGTPIWTVIPTQPANRAKHLTAALAPNAPDLCATLDESQIEAWVMAAATNGYRGILFQSCSPLNVADEATKRRAAAVEMLNSKLGMLAPWLTIGKRMGDAASTDAHTTACLLQVERARLLLPTWTAANANSANASAAFIVPGIPVSNQAYLLSPALLQSLPSKRVAGGTRLEFAPNGLLGVVLTEDPAVIASLRQRVAASARRAAQLQHNLAASRLRALSIASPRLASAGLDTKALDRALSFAQAEIGKANAQFAAGKFDVAYDLASSARTSLNAAYTNIEASLAAPNLLSNVPFATTDESLVPRLEFNHTLAPLRGGENQLRGGNFEDVAQLQQLGWEHIEDPIVGITSQVKLSAHAPHDGRYSLQLSAIPAPTGFPPQIVARPIVWIKSPPVHSPADQIVEITGFVRVPNPITGSIAGLQIFDSLGGPELALRVHSTDGWQPFRLLRATKDATEVTLTFALEGIGTAAIDGVSIRSLGVPTVKRLPQISTAPGPIFPNSANRSLFAPPGQR